METQSKSICEPKQPLVSIIVITYNSSKYVLETLESAKAQTYKNIELIISDDCSKDRTLEICENWIKQNQARFIRTELIVSSKNTGIAPNCNRGLKKAKGEWIKMIAGDDILTKDCIRIFVDYCKLNKSAKFVFSDCLPFCGNEFKNAIRMPVDFAEADAEHQLLYMLKKGNFIQGPTSFLKTKTLNSLGGYNETIPFSEDFPLWLKATHMGYKLHFISKICSFYRIHDMGIYTKSLLGKSYDQTLQKNVIIITKNILLPMLLEKKMYLHFWHNVMLIFQYKIAVNIKCKNKLLLKSVLFCDPLAWLIKFNLYKKILN